MVMIASSKKMSISLDSCDYYRSHIQIIQPSLWNRMMLDVSCYIYIYILSNQTWPDKNLVYDTYGLY